MRQQQAVKLRVEETHEKAWLIATGPTGMDEELEVERISLDIRESDYDFLERLAAYRNALAEAQGKKLKRQWSRKSLGESLMAAQCDQVRGQFAAMFDACGPFPSPDDKEAMLEYAKKVVSWDKRTQK